MSSNLRIDCSSFFSLLVEDVESLDDADEDVLEEEVEEVGILRLFVGGTLFLGVSFAHVSPSDTSEESAGQ